MSHLASIDALITKLFFFNSQMPTRLFVMQPTILHIYHIL